MNAGARDVEALADKRGHGRDLVSDFLPEIIGNFGNDRGVHPIKRPAQRGVFHDHGLQGDVAGALSDAEQRAVDPRGAVQPCRGGIGDRLVKIVVPVPLQHFAGHVGVVLQAVDDAGHAARNGHLGVRYTVAHGVAGADAHRNFRVGRHLHQLVDKRHDKAVKIGARDVLQVAARHNPCLKRICHRSQIVVHAFPAVHLHLFEDVVIAAGNQNPGLPDAQIPHQLEVLPAGTDPGRDFGELQPQLHTALHRLAVLFAVNEKFGLTDDAKGAAQPGHQTVKIHNLLHRIGLHRLLPIPEGCIGNPDVLRHSNRHPPVVKGNARHLGVGVYVAVEIGLLHILQCVFVGLLLE